MTNATSYDNSPKHQVKAVRGGGSFRQYSWLWLLCAAALLLFADGRNTIPLAAWLAPALLLGFVRTQPTMRGLCIAYVVLIVARGVAMRGMIPIPGIFYYIFMGISGISALLPYIADRLVAPHLKGVFNTLVFPCTLVAMQFVYSHGPVGSWGSIPYTQSGNLPLIQLLAVTGLWGIAFLIGWFAAVVNWTWWHGLGGPRPWHPLSLFAGVYLAVIMMGGARLALFPPSSPTVRVASLSPTKEGVKIADSVLKAVIEGKADGGQISQFRAATSAGQDELLTRSEREATAGAKIIFWSETGAFVLKQDEPDLLARGRDLASRRHVYLGMALGTWTPGRQYPLENKFVLIEPTGRSLGNTSKRVRHPVQRLRCQ